MDSKDYYLWEDDRAYISPTVGRDETLQFVDTLRESVGKNNDLISSQTQRLGTDISPSLGGLTGSEGYFQQRYQTLPVQNQVATLKATAQAKALNDLMSNYAAQAKNKYNQAYRNYTKRSGGSGGTGGGTAPEGGIEYEEDGWNEKTVPPKLEDYYVSGEEQTKRISERSGLPEWMVNILKIFGVRG